MEEGGEVWSTLVAEFGNVNRGKNYCLELVLPMLRGSQ